MFCLKLGLRNLLKNRRRSAKTVLVIVIGICSSLLAQGFMAHTLWGLRESLINGGLGHIQIYQEGYLSHGNVAPYQYLITDYVNVLHGLKEIPDVKIIAPRLDFQGLISSGEKSTVFMGTAGQPRAEMALNKQATLEDGSFLCDDTPYGVLIGSGVARKLHVGVGDTVTITSPLEGGGINVLDMEVIGIIRMQLKAYDDVMLLANLNTIQNFIDQPGSVNRVAILLTKTENMEHIEHSISELSQRAGLEFNNWRQLAQGQYTQPKLFFNLLYVTIMVIIVLVVVFSIINTLNLTMQERVREIGTIRSLGTTRFQVVNIFVAESFLLGVIGGFIGIVTGYGLAVLLNGLGGINIPPPPGQARGYIALFKPGFVQALQLWLVFLTTATIAGFYPAFKAARLSIVDALRWV
jgi:putative ABC transport system permease protein